MNTYTKYMGNLETIARSFLESVKKLDAKKEKLEKEKENPNKIYSDKYYLDEIMKNGNERRTLTSDAIDALTASYEKSNEVLKQDFTLRGSDLDQDTVALLNSGINIQQDEFTAICHQFENNVTMLRFLKDYADMHNLESTERMLNYNVDAFGKLLNRFYEEMKRVVFNYAGGYDAFIMTDPDLWQQHLNQDYIQYMDTKNKAEVKEHE